MRPLSLFLLASTALSASASAQTAALTKSQALLEMPRDQRKIYQLGSEWGKVPVQAAEVDGLSTPLARIAQATARVRYVLPEMYMGAGEKTMATAWYAGQFDATHVMATNFHVAEDLRDRDCLFQPRDEETKKIQFESKIWFELTQNSSLSGERLECDHVIGRWKEIDFALLAMKAPSSDAAQRLAGLGRNFAWKPEIHRGQALLTVGFGLAFNDESVMMKNEDADCRVLSGDNEFRQLLDPDTINPGGYAAWSFAHGCDISHGDSGSAFADRQSGDLIGIVWTAGTSDAGHPDWVRDSNLLARLMELHPENLWGVLSGDGKRYQTQAELAYSVPAAKIQERLLELLKAAIPADAAAKAKFKPSADQRVIADFLNQAKNAAK